MTHCQAEAAGRLVGVHSYVTRMKFKKWIDDFSIFRPSFSISFNTTLRFKRIQNGW